MHFLSLSLKTQPLTGFLSLLKLLFSSVAHPTSHLLCISSWKSHLPFNPFKIKLLKYLLLPLSSLCIVPNSQPPPLGLKLLRPSAVVKVLHHKQNCTFCFCCGASFILLALPGMLSVLISLLKTHKFQYI